MIKIFCEIARDTQGQLVIGARYIERYALELGVVEKTIEDWRAVRPEILFPRERIRALLFVRIFGVRAISPPVNSCARRR